jgi:hypothetical protein
MLAVGGVRQINLLRNSKNCLRKYFFLPTSTGFRQNIGTPTGRSGKFFGLFPYYDIYLQVLKLDGLAVIFSVVLYLYTGSLAGIGKFLALVVTHRAYIPVCIGFGLRVPT